MLDVKNISFLYENTPVLNGIDFQVKQGEYLAIIGESGSGKTTLLKLLYGTYDLPEGQVFWKDSEILGPKYNLVAGYDFMKYVAQEFDLMPFISVSENVGKFLSNFYPDAKQQRISELLEVVELTDFADVHVKNLSGGQKQRVALAQALANTPEIILLDEPFSHIDNFHKQSLRRNVFNYLKQQNITCIVATHDHEDVLGYADSVIVLDANELIASGTPERLYNDPQLPLIASFFGEFNLVDDKIYYAHQIYVVAQSNYKVHIEKSYFKGSFYLIEGIFEDDILYFNHDQALQPNSKVFIDLKELN